MATAPMPVCSGLAGATLLDCVFRKKWDDEVTGATHISENSGWAVVTGIKLDF